MDVSGISDMGSTPVWPPFFIVFNLINIYQSIIGNRPFSVILKLHSSNGNLWDKSIFKVRFIPFLSIINLSSIISPHFGPKPATILPVFIEATALLINNVAKLYLLLKFLK